MNHLSTINTILSAATAWPVAPLQMLQEQNLPFVVFGINSTEPLHSVELHPFADLVQASVLLFGAELDALQTEANKVRTAMQCHVSVQNSWITGQAFDYDPATNTYIIAQTYALRMPYTPYVAIPASGIGTMVVGSTFIII
jgi:hypothetical protein